MKNRLITFSFLFAIAGTAGNLAVAGPASTGPRSNVIPGPTTSAKTLPISLRPASDGALGLNAQFIHGNAGDPLAWLEQKVVANDGTTGYGLGWSIALDDTTAIVSSPDFFGFVPGAAYIFTRSEDGIWTQAQKLTPDDGMPGEQFGYAVALRGSTALVGSGATVDGNATQGAVYVYTLSGGVWTQTQKLTSDDGAAGDNFGTTMAFDGSTALIGAAGAAVGGNAAQGAVYVFTESNGVWEQVQKIKASDGSASENFGLAIAIDGDEALIGSNATINGNQNQGTAYFFKKVGGAWEEQQKLVAYDAAPGDGYFGASLDLEGSTALVGAQGFSVGGSSLRGAVYAFTKNEGVWAPVQKLIASDGMANDQFGVSVSMGNSTVIVGAPGAPNAQGKGVAYVFDLLDGEWIQSRKLTASDGVAGDTLGNAVAINHSVAITGAHFATVGDNFWQGAVYFYAIPSDQNDTIFVSGFDGP